MERYECLKCGHIHYGPFPAGYRCPVCGASSDDFKRLKELKGKTPMR
jgi:rubrerythrin